MAPMQAPQAQQALAPQQAPQAQAPADGQPDPNALTGNPDIDNALKNLMGMLPSSAAPAMQQLVQALDQALQPQSAPPQV